MWVKLKVKENKKKYTDKNKLKKNYTHVVWNKNIAISFPSHNQLQ